MSFTQSLIERTELFNKQIKELSFTYDGYVYNPLDYAWDMHKSYLENYVRPSAEVLLLGMNPGPYGMMQTGVPFGEVNAVRDYLKLDLPVERPKVEHPCRPVLGMAVTRSEVSGKRLWGLMAQRWANAGDFFDKHAVMNYCPLGFLDKGKTAKNFTPDHLEAKERLALEGLCDAYLKDIIDIIKPKALIGVGKYALAKLQAVNDDSSRIVDWIIHPSPGNPMANNDWPGKTTEKMKVLGLWN
ncbi:MAG: single-stranded DNA-binding protein [Sphaerochaetaceae bacterium]|nr:single-stranded DNA-binding protein [Sphaerochaetaceae bacterium]